MMEPYEQRVVLGWIANLGARLDRHRWAQDGLLRFLGDEADHLELEAGEDPRKLENEAWAPLIEARLAQLQDAPPSTLELNLRAVSDLLQLSAAEAAVMGALVRDRVQPQAEDWAIVLRSRGGILGPAASAELLNHVLTTLDRGLADPSARGWRALRESNPPLQRERLMS